MVTCALRLMASARAKRKASTSTPDSEPPERAASDACSEGAAIIIRIPAIAIVTRSSISVKPFAPGRRPTAQEGQVRFMEPHPGPEEGRGVNSWQVELDRVGRRRRTDGAIRRA